MHLQYFFLILCSVSVLWIYNAAALGLDLPATVSGNVSQATTRTGTDAIGRNVEHNLLKPVLRVHSSAGEIVDLNQSTDGKLLSVVLADGSVRLWDADAGNLRERIDAAGAKFKLAVPAKDGQNVFAVTDRAQLMLLDANTGATRQVADFASNPATALAVSRRGDTVFVGSADGSITQFEATTLRRKRSMAAHTGEVTGLRVAPDGQTIVSGGSDGSARVWDIKTGKPKGTPLRVGRSVVGIETDNDATVWIVDDVGAIHLWRDGVGPTLMRSNDAISPVAAAVGPGWFALGTDDGKIQVTDTVTLQTLQTFDGHAGRITKLLAAPTTGHLISAGSDGALRVWNVRTGANLLRLFITQNGWSVVDWQGRFDGSERGLRDLSWQAGKQNLPLDRFAKRFFEPGLVSAYLSPEASTLDPVPGAVEQGIAPPPQIELEIPPEASPSGGFRLLAIASDQGGGIDEIRMYHNGKLVDKTAQIHQQDYERDGQHLRAVAYDIQTVPGPNTFKAIASGRWAIEGHSEKLTKVVPGSERQSRLHLVAVGINRYQDRTLNLDYSVPDANAIADTLGKAGRSQFHDVAEHRLLDAVATKAGILRTLQDVGRADAQDVIVVYFAGHGLAIGSDWHFLPYETRSSNRLEDYVGPSISATEIQTALVAAKAQRAMVLIDSCESGAGAAAFNHQQSFQRRYLSEVSRIAGITVLAAARRDQTAAEINQLGHGLFTHVLLKGISGIADTQPTDGSVSAHEIVAYAADTIPRLSFQLLKHHQNPVAFALGADFLLGRK